MQRRGFLLGLGCGFIAPAMSYSAEEATPRIGYLSGRTATADRSLMDAFKAGLRSLGFVDGREVVVVYRGAQGDRAKLNEYGNELISKNIDVIFSSAGFSAAKAAHQARVQQGLQGSVPLVFVVGGDPVAGGLVSNLARPNNDMTGVTTFNSALELKQLELLRDMVAAKRKLGALLDARSTSTQLQIARIRQAEPAIGVAVDIRTAGSVPQLESNLRSFSSGGVEGVLVGAGSFFAANRQRIISQTRMFKLPAMFSQSEYAKEGGLASYSYNTSEVYRTAGEYVGKLLNGAATSELPVRMPTVFDLILNLRAAEEANIKLQREVIELATEMLE